jgi:Fe-S cluster assembly protein SufD
MQNLLEKMNSDFAVFEQGLNGKKNSEAHQIRLLAYQSLQDIGFPVGKAEEYKFTPLTSTLEKTFLTGENASPTEIDTIEIEKLITKGDFTNLVFVDGELNTSLSTKNDSLNVLSFEEALTNTEGLNIFGAIAKNNPDAFLAWNTSIAKQGYAIHVSKNKQVEKPVMVYYISTGNKAIYALRNLIVLEDGAAMKMAEQYKSIGTEVSFSNVVSEVVVGKNAHLEHSKIQIEQSSAYHYGAIEVSQDRDSVFTTSSITLDGVMIRNNVNIALEAENCEANMYGLYLVNGKTHIDNHTSVDHKKPNSQSNELYKGILDEKSRAVFNGKIFVRKEAQKTNAFQANNNVLLSSDAIINSKPQLEIWADDVKCSHGCTIGQLDAEAIFYLRARGIGEVAAKAMLLKAFAADATQKITIPELREIVTQSIDIRLHTNE